MLHAGLIYITINAIQSNIQLYSFVFAYIYVHITLSRIGAAVM